MQHKTQPSQIDKCSPAASNFIRQNVGLRKAIFHDTARPSPVGYFVSLALVIVNRQPNVYQ